MYACVCAHAQTALQCALARERASVRATATFHLGIIVHMYIIRCTRARTYTCVRALVESISARVGVGVVAGARAHAAGAGVH